MTQIDERIAPKELVVGLSSGLRQHGENLCFFTWYENGKLNSETSWRGWSSENRDNPLIVENKWSNGFCISGINQGRGRQGVNRDHMMIYHPLSETSFEISMANFISLTESCILKYGYFDDELLLIKKDRRLVNKKMYKELQEEADKKDQELANRNSKIVPTREQEPGKLYKDAKTGYPIFYLGTVEVSDLHGNVYKKHCYTNASQARNYLDKKSQESVKGDIIRYYENSYGKDKGKVSVYAREPDSCTKTKRKLSYNKHDINIFDHLNEGDWEHIFKQLRFTTYRRSYHSPSETIPNYRWTKIEYQLGNNLVKDIKINWREEYEKNRV